MSIYTYSMRLYFSTFMTRQNVRKTIRFYRTKKSPIFFKKTIGVHDKHVVFIGSFYAYCIKNVLSEGREGPPRAY